MNVELVEVSGCKRNLVVEVPPDVVDAEIAKLAEKYARNVRIPGFRPGKVPLGIVKQRFASELRNDATQDLIRRSFTRAVEEHQLHPLAEPVIEHLDAEPGNPMKFTVSFEILPAIEPHDYKDVPVTLPAAKVEDADVDRALDALREQHAEFIPVEDGEIRDGHLATLTVDGEFDGADKPIHEEDVVCVVGDPGTHESFSENLRGAKAGDERTFEVDYPEDHHRKRFAGKKVRYRAQVKEIKEKVLPALDDEFAADIGAESLAALRDRARSDLITKAESDAEKTARATVLDVVVRRHTFDVPESLVRHEMHAHARRIAASLARQGIDVNQAAIDWKKIFDEERPLAEEAVKRTLVLEAIARKEGLEATEEELDGEIREVAEATRKSPAAVRAQLEKDERIQSFKDHLRQKKALDFIFRNANISRG